MPGSDVIVLGGGAAGLFCAAQMGRRGRRVVVLEHNRQTGRKILISGGGRCNFTNREVRPENFLSENPHFAKSALARYRPADFLALLAQHRIAWHEKTLGQLFCDGSAAQIVAMLEAECAAAGVRIVTGYRVSEVRHDGEYVVGEHRAPVLVVATGGLSIPKIGATGLAFDLARQFGLRVVEPRPALVPLLWPGWEGLSGVAAECVARTGKRAFREKMLFTHRGLSGPAILQISSYWRPGEAVELNLAPGRDLAAELIARKQERISARTALAAALPARLAERLAANEPLAEWTDKECRKLGEAVHRFRVEPTGTEGYEKAEVTAGGVDTAELSSTTMEARRQKGLFFLGEAVDVTGWLGGYNFQWAWASAYAAATGV
ncbi:MAG: aminoacetone oxidase family FAD-binding enzyme [Acidobacteriaceae bacterium]|nr:aminoacetone oxidase family FAD-binding enzyme [Acidobacteriaceae bacterium]